MNEFEPGAGNGSMKVKQQSQ